MSLSYAALSRMCNYMIANNDNRKTKLGPAVKPGSTGIADIYKKQRIETCFKNDGTEVREEFKPKPPSENTFRTNIERLVANSFVLADVNIPEETEIDMEDNDTLEHYAYLLPKFEELRTNPTEKVPVGQVAGIGLTKSALLDAVSGMKTQASHKHASNQLLERNLKLQFIEHLISVAAVFRREPTKASDRTWQQDEEAAKKGTAAALQQESATISASARGLAAASVKLMGVTARVGGKRMRRRRRR